jgi:NADH:ubiquinone oxidoreductase subunit 3 (subunit A)
MRHDGAVSTPTHESRTRPSAWWYALPAMLLVVATLASVLLFVWAFDRFADVARSVSGGTVEVSDEQLSIFATGPGDLDPTAPTPPGRCTLTPTAGGAPVTTESSSIDLSYSAGDRQWERIAVVPGSATPGRYEIACPGYTIDELRVASTDGIKDGVLLVVAAVIVPIVGLVLAVVTFVVVLVLRNRSKNRNRAAASAYLPPPAYGGQPPFWHQPPPYEQQPPYAGQPPPPGEQPPE